MMNFVFYVNYFMLHQINLFCIDVAMSDTVHDVQTVYVNSILIYK